MFVVPEPPLFQTTLRYTIVPLHQDRDNVPLLAHNPQLRPLLPRLRLRVRPSRGPTLVPTLSGAGGRKCLVLLVEVSVVSVVSVVQLQMSGGELRGDSGDGGWFVGVVEEELKIGGGRCVT